MFAIVSEVAYNVGFYGKVFYWKDQNVYFTLALGLISIMFCDKAIEMFNKKNTMGGILAIIGIAGCMAAAWFLKTAYSWFGVASVVCFFLFRKKELFRNITVGVFLVVGAWFEIFALPAIFILHKYNGKSGYKSKVTQIGFYIFYPAHILLLYGLKLAILG